MSQLPFYVAIADPMPQDQLGWLQNLALPYGIALSAPQSADESELKELLSDAQGLVTQNVPVTADLLESAPNLRVIQKKGGRRDNLDLRAIRDRDIQIALMPLPGSVAVAEHAMSLMLALGKKLLTGHTLTASGAYRDLGIEPKQTTERSHGFQWMKIPGLVEFSGLTLGIFGFGDIGTEIAKRARAFDMDIVYHKRSRLEADLEAELGVTYVSKQELLKQSDVLVMISPLTSETEKAIGGAELALMKPEALLINVSRGGVIDELALADALREKRIAGAGLDVFVQEPVPFDHPYLSLDNIVLTPHIAGGKGGGREREAHAILANLKRHIDCQPMKYQLTAN